MKSASRSIIVASLLGAASATAELPVGCTEDATAAGITLRGNADGGGSWTELYKEPLDDAESSGPRLRGATDNDTDDWNAGPQRGAQFDLAFEMRCDADRTFDLEVTDGAGEEVYSVSDAEFDHTYDEGAGRASFAAEPFWLEEGRYGYCLSSKIGGLEEARVCGHLTSVMDKEPPVFEASVVSPGTAVAPGTMLAFYFEVTDDAALDHLHVQKNGETYEWLTLAFGEDFLAGAMGTQSVTVAYEVPAEMDGGEDTFAFELCDRVGNCVEETEQIRVLPDDEESALLGSGAELVSAHAI